MKYTNLSITKAINDCLSAFKLLIFIWTTWGFTKNILEIYQENVYFYFREGFIIFTLKNNNIILDGTTWTLNIINKLKEINFTVFVQS